MKEIKKQLKQSKFYAKNMTKELFAVDKKITKLLTKLAKEPNNAEYEDDLDYLTTYHNDLQFMLYKEEQKVLKLQEQLAV